MKARLPVLYLANNVFYPNTIIPMLVNDKSSVELVLKCYTKGELVVLHHASERSKGIGTVGKIIHIDHSEKGVTAMIQGLSRVKLQTQVQHLPYPIYECSEYLDFKHDLIVLENVLERLHHILGQWLNRHISSRDERALFMKEIDSPQKLVNNICLLLLRDLELKEILLENQSLSERIRIIDAVLRGVSPDAEDQLMSEAIKDFEKMQATDQSQKWAI